MQHPVFCQLGSFPIVECPRVAPGFGSGLATQSDDGNCIHCNSLVLKILLCPILSFGYSAQPP